MTNTHNAASEASNQAAAAPSKPRPDEQNEVGSAASPQGSATANIAQVGKQICHIDTCERVECMETRICHAQPTPALVGEPTALEGLVNAFDARHAFTDRDNSGMSDADYQQAAEAVDHAFDSAMIAARAALSAPPTQDAADDEAEFTGANLDRRTDVGALIKAEYSTNPIQGAELDFHIDVALVQQQEKK